MTHQPSYRQPSVVMSIILRIINIFKECLYKNKKRKKKLLNVNLLTISSCMLQNGDVLLPYFLRIFAGQGVDLGANAFHRRLGRHDDMRLTFPLQMGKSFLRGTTWI